MEFQQSLVRTKVSAVPSFLVDSEFHKSLSSEADPDESIAVPLPCFKHDETVENEIDVENLLNTSRYWGVNHISLSIVRYYLLQECPVSTEIIAEFGREHGYLNNIKMLQDLPRGKQLDKAIAIGDSELAIAMYRVGYAWTERSASEAAKVGNLALLQFARANGCVWDKTTAYEAVANGHLDCLKYTREEQCPWDEHTLAVACNKSVECVRYICEQATVSERSAWLTRKQAENAVFLGTLDMLICLRAVDCPWSERVTTIAAREGKVDCLRYACYNGCPVTAEATNTAARWGHLHCLQFLHEEGVAWGPETCESAVRGGSLACLQFLHSRGCAWDARTCTAAARADRLDILEFAHIHGCPPGCAHMRSGCGHLHSRLPAVPVRAGLPT